MTVRELAGHCASGAVAGCAVEAAFYPLDTIKTRLQARRHGERVALFRGLYRGVGGNLLGVAPASAVFFAAYEPMKRALGAGGDAGGGEGGGVRAHLTAGATAGLASSLIRVPTEVIKTRRQVGTSAASSLRGILAAHGVMGLFAGYWSFLLRDLPFDAIEFAGYESLKQAWGSFADKEDVNGAEAAALGAIAGAFTGAVTTPLDVVKTRLMTSPDSYTGVVQCVRKTIAEEGAMALLKGVEPRVMWIGLGGGCFFSVLETARGIFVPKRESEGP
jgi:solute carrier family 25 S-adenosylmethionine transporter 26